MTEYSSMTALQADQIDALKEENARLAERVKVLEGENSSLLELDDMATRRDQSYCREISSLQAQVDVLKELIRTALDPRC